jgi:hypothetical protein
MHREILSTEQQGLLPVLKLFAREGFYLAGGTAVALYIGHRHSLDYDLFTGRQFRKEKISGLLQENRIGIQKILFEDSGQLDLLIDGVKITFMYYPYQVKAAKDFEQVIGLPALPDLAALKCFALGRRAKWKDYVDLFFILRDHLTLPQLAVNAERMFGGMFSEKLLREQLAYFDDIDYTEKVDYLTGYAVEDSEIKEFLIRQATEKF